MVYYIVHWERQCITGQESAKSGKECEPGQGPAGQYHQDCCEGCKLGLIAGAMGLQCEFQALKLALGPPWDTSLTRCCLQAGGSTGTSRATQPVSRPTPSGPTPSTFRSTQTSPTERQDFCTLFQGQLCGHICVTEGNSYRCQCRQGYRLLPDGKSCQQDPSSSNPSDRERDQSGSQSRPVNQCPVGFVYNVDTQVCDDIDECLLSEGARACFPYKKCRNTIGSFLCEERDNEEDKNQQCPPGYRYKDDTATCVDIDECAEGYDICVREIQYCINTPGGFDCQGKKEFNRYNCPAGYKFNNNTLNCEDVNECSERLDSCDRNSEVCRNTAGAYECDAKCSAGFRYDIHLRNCQDIDECREGTHDCRIEKESCVNVPGSYQCHQLQASDKHNCPPGYEPNRNYTFLCQDRDECSTGLHTCAPTETCINEVGGYRCEVGSGDDAISSTEDIDYEDATTTTPSSNTESSILDSVFRPSPTHSLRNNSGNRASTSPNSEANVISKSPGATNDCTSGYRVSRYTRHVEKANCEDIDECVESDPCDRTQICQNTPGSFYCHCKTGYYRDPVTRACLDINECQTGQHNCAASQRCDNSPGSYTCIRITGCGTGYTLNSVSGLCEDDDECLFGNHDCGRLGPEWTCKNTLGSFRCERASRQCPSGLALAPNGECRPACTSGYHFNQRGDCLDIDECKPQAGVRSVCSPTQQCVNTQGSYQCISKIICPAGYESDVNGTKCEDIDECERGTHTCKGNQQCRNRGGGFICQCPTGYIPTATGYCEDVDECTRFGSQVCASNAECHNTQGSFRCICKQGFEHASDNRTCADVDECMAITGLCEQNCINTWGSYKCSCGAGFTLSEDGRTCRDVDECAQAKPGFLCVGTCVNTHGSYQCDCPNGYRLGADSRTCQDIDECETPQICRSDETCLNTRGGFRCNRIQCPSGYQRDGDQTDRCKKTVQCSERDLQCLKQPLTISRNFISFTSNIRIPTAGYVDLFTMRGPTWHGAVMHFNLQVKNSRAGHNVAIASRQHFLLRRPTPFQAVVALAKPISGPQDVELELVMEVYHRDLRRILQALAEKSYVN
ncbi:unnamed protein product [Allacma fusca]|uniref:Fibulin-1 n=1 Tax=Allacma fusca TaxID=39272 RepID=A0A8J2PAN7_9HEXA|nr:unnamed protein product [Allacma fusca]